tara:strand:- start:67 stop:339 length:273 start_codon:yes stop_codon:yes gene_type:complete
MLDKRDPGRWLAPNTRSKLRLHLRLPHPVLPSLRSSQKNEAMKPARKIKITIVLSASILLNVFLLWELKRSNDYSKALEQQVEELQVEKN